MPVKSKKISKRERRRVQSQAQWEKDNPILAHQIKEMSKQYWYCEPSLYNETSH